MLNWMKWVGWKARDHTDAGTETRTHRGAVMSGKYLSLYTYLVNRYADAVVLTFAEIEDLLGFALPDPARLRQDWWTSSNVEVATSSHRDAWILAKRTAKPNLLAQTVLFDRVS